MQHKVELIDVGDEVGFILPDAALRHLKVTLGDSVDLNVIPHGFTLTKRETDLD